MIKIEHTEVYGWEAAIRGMRNPFNSWDKSDSGWEYHSYETLTRITNEEIFEIIDKRGGDEERGCEAFIIGPNDKNLMKRLVKAGTDHSKFMRMINVTVDITAPLYWWKEFDTYKVGTVANSCSTMHKIHEKEFTMEDFSYEHLSPPSLFQLKNIVRYLNDARELFIKTKNKDYWWQMIQLLPSSYNQKRTVQLTYAVLRNMYHSRKGHKLDEWREGFCEWIEWLPCSELITE